MYNAIPNRRDRMGLPNPFRTLSNFLYPKTIKDVFIWAQYLWERNAKYRRALQKVVSYFISDISITQQSDADVDSDALEGFKDTLTDTYNILPFILDAGCELASMGNVFVSAERIFSRELLCPTPGCGFQMHLKSVQKGRDYDWDGRNFVGTCPKCGKRVVWTIKDVKSQTADGQKIRFVIRSAEDMRLQYNRLTNTYKYLYKLPDDIVTAIKRGDVVYLEDSPKVFLDAAANPDQLIAFPEDMFFSMRTTTLSALDRLYKGWGVPLFMVAFDNVIRLQHLGKFNEAVVMDYLVPTRIVSPLPQNLKAGIDDPNRAPLSGAMFSAFMTRALKGKINNPTQWIVSPVPVQQAQIGGDKEVIPTELLEYETTQFLSDMGIPQEFRQTTFQVVAPTMGLRMFERQWIHFAKGLNRLVKWAGSKVAEAHNFEDMQCDLDMTSFVEDDMNKQMMLQLMQAGVVAKGPVLKRLGVDYEDDIKQRNKEQQLEMEAANKMQTAQEGMEMVGSVMPLPASPGVGQAQMNIEMMQQQAAGGAAPEGPAGPGSPAAPMGGGAPAGGAPMPFGTSASESASIEQLFQEAQNMAQELYSAPPNVRRQQLTQLKASNPTMHAFVKQILNDMSQQVASDAVAQSRQPQG